MSVNAIDPRAIVAVTGLEFEARIAAGPGVTDASPAAATRIVSPPRSSASSRAARPRS